MLDRKNSLIDAITAIIDEKGIEVVNSPGLFCAIIDDIIPQLENEKNIMHRSMNEKAAQYIVEAYYSENAQRDFILSKLDMYLKDSLGISEEWRATFLNSFSKAFSWNYTVEIESSRGIENVNEVVEKEINFSRYIPDIIAAGASHIVGLKDDGTVIAVGDNSNGQCNVKSWKNVIAVSAWGLQTVGLLQDGSVIQTGSVALGVTADVSMIKNWNNMISVSAGATNIIGLRNNGKAFGCGANQSGQCDVLPWNNIIAVATGHGHTLGLKKDGTVISTGSNKSGQCEVSEWNDIRAIAVGVSHSIGLRNDGTVVATGKNDYGECNLQDWNNIIAVKACLQHTIGLKSDGTVIMAGRYTDKYDVSGWTDIVSIDINCKPAGMGDYFMNIVGVKSDGTIVFAGDDNLVQGNVSGWNLFSAPGGVLPAPEQFNRNLDMGIQRALSKRIATGAFHALAIREDGKVIATGDNRAGQCNVSGWTDVIGVVADAFHSVGLKADGTVIATQITEQNKKFDVGQCNVGNWTNIIDVAVGNAHTVGLRIDGTVVATGSNRVGQCNVGDWKDIIAISARGGLTLGLKTDGTVLSTGVDGFQQCSTNDWKNVEFISAGGGHSVALTGEGSVLTTKYMGNNYRGQCDISDFKNIVMLSANAYHTVGLKNDGTVISTQYTGESKLNYGQTNVDGWKDVIAISASGTLTIALLSDGKVTAIGDNNYGQCNVNGWKLFYNLDDFLNTVRKQQSNLLSAKKRIKEELLREQESLVKELSQLKGLFSGKRRKQIEERLLKIEKELR